MANLRSIGLTSLLLVAAAVASGADWKNQPFPNWNDDLVIRLVTDSPWAHAKSVNLMWVKPGDRPFDYKDVPGTTPNGTIKGGSPVGGIGVPRTSLPPKADIIVRWVSALPIRHATALYKLRQQKLGEAKLNSLIGAPSQDYVLEIFGVPAEVAHMGAGVVELETQRTSFLRTRSGRTIKPSKVEVVPQGLTISIQIHFPNSEPITIKDEEIECMSDLQIFRIHEKFRLSQMVYQNHLEL
ncbi:hypothetical protein [uncultured Paludibaculum sp.]|uniref:hypothetical protein n=1 Tax=uncultured Paludibaculum sp. TaxID=1765020 RepID=UPI002AAC10BE|nr:hypothetical protein [uncultured Paludibaculum sp.]